MAGSGTAHLRREADDTVLTVNDLVVEFPTAGNRTVHAVSGLNFDLAAGETLGILGESGCGKSSAARALMQLPAPTSGRVLFGGAELTTTTPKYLRRVRTKLHMVMQDPVSSLNPRRKVKDLVAEGPSIRGGNASRSAERVAGMLREVGLDPTVVWDRRPHELSGGQCQRVCIARALMLEPEVLVCDEPVSSLDVSVQAQILNLLERTKQQHGLSMLFIAHDVAVVKNVSDRVMVMYAGKTCEVLPSRGLHRRALHPYTRLLLGSVPGAYDEAVSTGDVRVDGELPSPVSPPSGCRFRTRCPLATELCAHQEPELRHMGGGQYVACHHIEPGEAGGESVRSTTFDPPETVPVASTDDRKDQQP